jgi:hypothetical protein
MAGFAHQGRAASNFVRTFNPAREELFNRTESRFRLLKCLSERTREIFSRTDWQSQDHLN